MSDERTMGDPTEEQNGREERERDGKNKAEEAGGRELNILRWIELKMSKNNTNWTGV